MAGNARLYSLVFAPPIAKRLARLPPKTEHAIRSHFDALCKQLQELPEVDLQTQRLVADRSAYEICIRRVNVQFALDGQQRRVRLLRIASADQAAAPASVASA